MNRFENEETSEIDDEAVSVRLLRDSYPDDERIEMPEDLAARILTAFRRESKWSTGTTGLR